MSENQPDRSQTTRKKGWNEVIQESIVPVWGDAERRALEGLKPRPRKTIMVEQKLRDLFTSDEDYERYLRMREENQNG
jgi:hypothetical protein